MREADTFQRSVDRGGISHEHVLPTRWSITVWEANGVTSLWSCLFLEFSPPKSFGENELGWQLQSLQCRCKVDNVEEEGNRNFDSEGKGFNVCTSYKNLPRNQWYSRALFQAQKIESQSSRYIIEKHSRIAMCHSSTRLCYANCHDEGLILDEELMNPLASLVAQASEGDSGE